MSIWTGVWTYPLCSDYVQHFKGPRCFFILQMLRPPQRWTPCQSTWWQRWAASKRERSRAESDSGRAESEVRWGWFREHNEHIPTTYHNNSQPLDEGFNVGTPFVYSSFHVFTPKNCCEESGGWPVILGSGPQACLFWGPLAVLRQSPHQED